jgi:hypothetical protein
VLPLTVQVNTALAYAQLARHLRFETSSSRSAVLQHSSYLSLQGLAVQQAAVLNPRQVSMVLTSLAWMQCPAEEAVAPAGTAWSAAHDSSSTMQQQAAAADGTALRSNSGSGMVASPAGEHQKAEQQPQVVLLGMLSQRLHVLVDSFEPEDTCHCLWALSKLSALQPNLLAAVTAHSLSHDWLHSLTAKPLSSLLWVHAQAHLQHQQHQPQLQQQQQGTDASLQPLPQQHVAAADSPQGLLVSQLVVAVMHEVSQPGFLATWTPQELSMLLWCCAVLGVPLQQQQEAVAAAAALTQATEPEQHLQRPQGVGAEPTVTARLHAAAQLPVSVLQQVCQLACQHVVQFTPQGIAMVCWSVAQLVSTAAPAGAAPSQQQGWHAGHPVLAALPQQLHQPVTALVEAFAAAAASRLHYYKPQEVCNIFTACCRLQLLPLALKQTVESYISSHTHLLGCRDVTDLLLAAAQLQQQRRGQHRSGAALGPVSVRALLHRTGQLLPELSGFQCGAAAWACVRLAELQESAYSSPSGGSGSNRGRVANSSGSTLQEECMAMASSLLDCLDRQLAEAAAGSGEVSTAVDSPAVASLVQRSSGRAQAASVLENAGDLKQAVALSWALAAASSTSSTHSWGPSEHAGDSAQHRSQHPMLLASVLQELQQGVQGCDASSLVQALCVLVRLHPVLSTSCAADRQQAGQQATATPAQQVLVQQLHATATARLVPLVPRLSPAEAATAAWAVVKLQVLQKQRHTACSGEDCADSRSGAVSLLSAVLKQLHDQQQLSSLAGQSVASLLWCCRAMGWVPRAAVYCQLLAAADAKLLQLQPQQQLVVLSAAAAIAGARMVPWQAQHVALDLQQLQRQQARLLHGAMEQLQATLQQQASQLDLQLNSPRAAASRGHPASTNISQHAAGCGPEDLVSLVAACRSLQLQDGPLLQQVCEVWQLLLQQDAVSTHQVLRMVWHLADVLQDSPAEPWHAAILRQQQQLPGSPITLGQGSQLLPQLLHHAVAALNAQLAAAGSALQQGHHRSGMLSAHTLALAVRVFAKLRYQPPAQVLAAVLQQLQAVLHLLPGHDAVAVLSAAAQLALPVPQLAAALASELHGRERASQHMWIAGAAVGQRQHKPQKSREAGSNSTHSAEPLMLLWSVLCSEVVTGGTSSSVTDGQHKRVLARLAREAAGLPQEQLLHKPQLALMSQQVWRMLHQLQDFAHIRRAAGLAVPKLLLPWQFRSMTHVLLPSSMVGPARQQARLQLLCADQQQQKAIVCQRLHAALHEQAMSDRPVMSMQHMAQLFTNLLPLWLQYQLQKHCQEQLARELVKAQVAAGFAAAGVRLRILPSGEVVLVLQPQQPARRNPQQRRLQCQWLLALRMRSKQAARQQRLAAQTGLLPSAPMGAGSSSQRRCKGVAVVLEAPNNLAVNTGQLLGSARVRDALLCAEGYHVLSLPLQCWLPEFVQQHQHSMQLQVQQEQPGRQLHVQKLQWKKLNRLQKKRKQQVQQLLEALYLCSRHSRKDIQAACGCGCV